MISNTEQTPEEHKNNKCQITHTLFKMDFTTDATSTPPEKDTSFRNYSGALQKKNVEGLLDSPICDKKIVFVPAHNGTSI
jgi:hypothetical protein